MRMMYYTTIFALFSFVSLVVGHARMKHPRPLAAPPDSPSGNYYNNPLRADGSEFPCKNLHKQAGINKNPTETWQPGQMTRFEIVGHGDTGGEGSLAAHSGGSCQASISFDNGETWKVLHSFIGGCPRGARLGSNMADKNQTFPFRVPENTKAGNALFSWSWIAVTGNRNEFYQNCASILIAGSGNSTLDHLPDMFVGDMTLSGHIGPGECRSTARFAIEYPDPGEANTFVEVQSIAFKKPTGGKCYTRASVNRPVTSMSSTSRVSGPTPSSTLSTTGGTTDRSSITSKVSLTTTASSTTQLPSTTDPLPTVSSSANGLPSQCSKYALITDRTRHSSQPGYITCDKAIFKNEPTWVRFSGGAGTRLAKGPAEPFRCGTQGAGWYSGVYPSNPGDTISAKVCYSWPGNSCQWSNNILITDCKDYHVFALRAPPACYLRYCTI